MATPPLSSGPDAAANGLTTSFKVLLYFALNPDEELTSVDVSIKYGCAPKTARGRLANLVRHGLLAARLERHPQPNCNLPLTLTVYGAGPALRGFLTNERVT